MRNSILAEEAESPDLRVEAFICLPLALTPESLAGLQVPARGFSVHSDAVVYAPLNLLSGSPESAYAGKESFLGATVPLIKWVVTIVTRKYFFRFVELNYMPRGDSQTLVYEGMLEHQLECLPPTEFTTPSAYCSRLAIPLACKVHLLVF